jgi:hypothetical protein
VQEAQHDDEPVAARRQLCSGDDTTQRACGEA